MKNPITQDMSIASLQQAYADGRFSPRQVLADIQVRADQYSDRNIWIHRLEEDELEPFLQGLGPMDLAAKPLWGIPFAIKDNIDLAGIPTTAGCPEFAYTASRSAVVVQQLIDAGAIPVGKTNLDQFATGLNGTRSPFGPCKNAFDPDYVSGGSSAGSAVSVALGLASFSLGTDTAGSGRVPACFNNLIGVKPTRGLLSSTGLVPACKSLDCITIFAYNSDDANRVLAQAEGYDIRDGYSRKNPFYNQRRQFGLRRGKLTIGIIPENQLQFFGDSAYQRAYADTLDVLRRSDIDLQEIDYTPFDEAAKLLYEGPWVTERYLAIESLLRSQPEAVFPVVRDIIAPGSEPKATQLFTAQYRLAELKHICDRQLEPLDCLLTPTAGRCFTIESMLDEPILHNSQLGYYTNFMNLLDMASVAVPTQIAGNGLPFGVTLVGPTLSDRALLSMAARIHGLFNLPAGALSVAATQTTPDLIDDTAFIDVVVCGAHLQGLPLNWQLSERGGQLVEVTQTAPIYRMYALAGGPPFRPGLIVDEAQGAAIDVEVWRLPTSEFGSFVNGIPAPLGMGKVKLACGRFVSGFICEPYGITGAEEITQLGGWRAYLKQRSKP